MQLTGQEITRLGCIQGQVQTGIRPASYDLSIGSICIDGKERTEETYEISPQQVVILVSSEIVTIPDGHVGYAMPKTGLCMEGILTLNTGIVDPGWNGKLSSVAISFEKSGVELRKGEPFLRLVVHKLSDPQATGVVNNQTPEEYLSKLRTQSKSFPNTFLDLPGHIDEATDKLLKKQMSYFLTTLTVVGILLGFFTFIGPQIDVGKTDYTETEVQLLRQQDSQQRALQTLEERINRIESATTAQASGEDGG